MQNKIDHANRMLRLMEKHPNMIVKELLFIIDCRIEGEKFVISSYRWSVPMIQETYDNRDNREMFQFLVWHEGVGQWGAYILLPDRARYYLLRTKSSFL